MPDITWTHPALPRILHAIPAGVTSLVDLGCGSGIMGALCRVYRDPVRTVGVDAYDPYLERVRARRLYDEVVKWRLEEAPLPFRDREFEVATCIEVIEHLPRDAGERLLDELERIAGRVVISTPNWFFDQEKLDGNPLQVHRSLWRERDFTARGYAVTGVGGMKILGRHVRVLSTLLGPATLRLPRLSTLILCVRG